MSREVDYSAARVERLKQAIDEKDQEIARLQTELRTYRERCLVPAALKIIEEHERRTGT